MESTEAPPIEAPDPIVIKIKIYIGLTSGVLFRNSALGQRLAQMQQGGSVEVETHVCGLGQDPVEVYRDNYLKDIAAGKIPLVIARTREFFRGVGPGTGPLDGVIGFPFYANATTAFYLMFPTFIPLPVWNLLVGQLLGFPLL